MASYCSAIERGKTTLRGIDDKRIRDSRIIKCYHEGITPTQLSERFQLSMSQIFNILRSFRKLKKKKKK